MRRFYEAHHEGIEALPAAPPLLLRLPDPDPAGARPGGPARARPRLRVGAPAGGAPAVRTASGIDVSRARDPRRRARATAASRCASSRATSPTPPCWRAPGGPFDVDPPRQRGHPPHRRAGDARGAARGLPLAHAGARSTATAACGSRCCGSPSCWASSTAQPPESWLPPEEIKSMLSLADFEVVRDDAHLVCPVRVPLLADLAEPLRRPPAAPRRALADVRDHRPPRARALGGARARPQPSVSVVIPCRNEAGHIRPLVDEPARAARRAASSCSSRATRTDDTAAVIQQRDRGAPRAAPALPQAAGQGQGRRRAPRLRAGEGRRAAHPRLRHGRRPRRRAEVRGRARPRQGRDGERLAPRLPDGGQGDALPEPAREQVLRVALLAGCSASRCATRCAARRPSGARTTSGSPRTARTSGTSTPSATSTCCSAPRASTSASSTSRCATTSAATARPTSRASATAGCCCR